ncbi:MAG: SRPBCC domain-containing protein [Bacteroidota bacterium]|nr:SRPBCC domain-containing protein [Bacteroidota bacterium]
MKTITKSIFINAPESKVWEVLTADEYTRQWYSVFSPGSHAQTDWEVGSKVVFSDNSGGGMIAKVMENKPGEILSLQYTGILADGKEDYTSAEAAKYAGGKESYLLFESNEGTQLDISSDMSEEMFETMSQSWEKALEKLKALAEENVDALK